MKYDAKLTILRLLHKICSDLRALCTDYQISSVFIVVMILPNGLPKPGWHNHRTDAKIHIV